MKTRHTLFSLAIVLLVSALASGAALAQTDALTIDNLKYEGATVDVEVDVNGEAAVQLVGGILDEAAAIVQDQAGAEGLPSQLAMAQPFIGPAKDAIKSLSRAIALVMKTDESAADLDAAAHYGAMMAARGWSPLATVRTGKGENILVMIAPSAKGVFAVVRPNRRELIVALITTNEPIGDLLAQVVRAAGGDILPNILQARAAKMERMQQQAECEETAETEEVETAEAPAE
ncbi:MAG: hypothetical protein OEV33_05675 [Armatimonadota bacterium]|nr:hypothetical protein [Armatimonadota bacterium]